MPSANLTLISHLYQNFAKGDVPAVLGAMSPDIVWNEAENNPYADGNPYIGPQAVLDGVFMRFATDWDDFSVSVNELLDAGDTIVALCRYGGVYTATGRSMNPHVVHVWRLSEGKITHFQQYLDTLQVVRAMGQA
jgi:uncharacterized protein